MMDYQPVTTEIIDDGPKWKSIAILVIAGALAVAVTVIGLQIVDQLLIDERSAQAIRHASAVSDALIQDKIDFWRFTYLALIAVISGLVGLVWLCVGAIGVKLLRWAAAPVYQAPQIETIMPDRVALPPANFAGLIEESQRRGYLPPVPAQRPGTAVPGQNLHSQQGVTREDYNP